MTYLLDTNVCIKLLNNSSQAVVKRLVQEYPKKVNLGSIIEFELFYGAYRSQKTEENIRRLKQFFRQFNVLDFERKCAKIAGYIRSQLIKKSNSIGVYDLQITAITLTNDLILVTHIMVVKSIEKYS